MTAVITGIIERDAVEALEAADIEVVANEEGSARDAAEAYLAHTLIGADEWHNDERPSTPSKREEAHFPPILPARKRPPLRGLRRDVERFRGP